MIVGDEEDEDVDDGFVEVELHELIDPRLLKAAEESEKSGGQEEGNGQVAEIEVVS